ncbi:MAG: RHS repeat protein, partial [Desulfobulbus sp.]|uniref:RHS repeat domain-containing protein n=1 Tax=Desulfobulbus sp. TaxID=895 RepID=UPI0028470FA9
MRFQARNIRPILLSSLLTLMALQVGFADGHASSQPYLSGHGINFATGNKYLVETDIVLGGAVKGMAFQRFYNSQSTEAGIMGYGWSCPLTERLIDNTSSIALVQKDGRHVAFASDGQGGYIAALGSSQTITRITGGFRLTLANRDVHVYNSAGRLTNITFRNGASLSYTYSGAEVASIADSLGRTLGFTYTGGRLTGLSTPQGNFTYGYDGN